MLSSSVIVFLACAACQRHREAVVSPDAPVVKIAVHTDGRLLVDGSPSNIESLRASLKSASEAHGAVLYYREAGQQEPPPIAMQVMRAIVEARLPVRLCTQPDYSDAIGADGRLIPP